MNACLGGNEKEYVVGRQVPAAYSFFVLVYTILRFTRYRALLSANADGTFVNGLRKTNVCFAAACFSLRALDYIITPWLVWLDQIGESDIIQIIIDQFVKSSPHRECAAAVHTVAGKAFRGFQAGDGGQ